MRTRAPFSFDEAQDAKNILDNGFSEKTIDHSKMYAVSKYIKESLGYGATRLERELITFCKTQDPRFNPIREAESIKKWVNAAMNYGLRKVDEVIISNQEIEFLNSVVNVKKRKILFCALVFGKALKKTKTKKQTPVNENNQIYIRYANFKDIARMTGLKTITEVDVASAFHNQFLIQNVYCYPPEKELLRLDFADLRPDEAAFIIDNLRNPMEYYEKLISQFPLCSVCKKPIEKRSNRQQVCDDCKPVLTRNRVKKFRKNKKILSF